MIRAEITLADGTQMALCEGTWEELFKKIEGLNIKHLAGAQVRINGIRQGKQRGASKP